MSQELHIIRASEFVRMDPHGYFDLATSKAALAELAAACRKRGIKQAMIDLRALHPGPKPVFSPADLAELVGTFCQIGFTRDERLAILYKSDPYRRARLFAFLSTMHGWSVKAFGDFEEALLWLSSTQEPQDRGKQAPGTKQVPIRFEKSGRKRPASGAAHRRVRRSLSSKIALPGQRAQTKRNHARPPTSHPTNQTKAAGDSRTPKLSESRRAADNACVLECGCPLPLSCGSFCRNDVRTVVA